MNRSLKRIVSLALAITTISTAAVGVSAAGIKAEDEEKKPGNSVNMPTYPEDYLDWLDNPLLWGDPYNYFYGYEQYPEGYQNPNVIIEQNDVYRWFEIDQGTYKGERFCLKNGQLVKGLAVIEGNTYCFNEKGLMIRSSWVTCNGDRFYMSSTGAALKGWYEINGYKYYFDKSSGAAARGIVEIKGVKYAFAYNCKLVTNNFIRVGKSTYYANSAGKIVTGWKKINDNYYYFNSTGKMVTGTVEIDGVMYRFNSKGVYQYRIKELKDE